MVQQQQQETDKQHASWQLPVWPQCQAHPHPKTETKARDKINKKILFEQSTSLPLLLRRRRLSWKPNKSHNNNSNAATEQQQRSNSFSPSSNGFHQHPQLPLLMSHFRNWRARRSKSPPTLSSASTPSAAGSLGALRCQRQISSASCAHFFPPLLPSACALHAFALFINYNFMITNIFVEYVGVASTNCSSDSDSDSFVALNIKVSARGTQNWLRFSSPFLSLSLSLLVCLH